MALVLIVLVLVGVSGFADPVDRLNGFAARRLAGVRVLFVCLDVRAVIAVRAAWANGRIVVAVVPGRDMHTDGVERAVRDILHRRWEHIGGREPNPARREPGDCGRGYQLESCPAHPSTAA